MPTTLRVRTGFCDADVDPPARHDDRDRKRVPRPPRPARFDRRHNLASQRVVNSLAGWVGVAIALSIALYASHFAQAQGTRDSVVTTWVAGVVGTLAVVPSVLFAVSAHRDMRRYWAPAIALVAPALLAANLILPGL